jgi:predicted MFS family arabinose efflux permease
VSSARWLPYLLFGLVAGVLIDRSRRLPILVSTDLACGVLLLSVPALALAQHLTLVALMAIMAAFGLLSLINEAAAQSFVPRLVPRTLLTPANARLDQSDAVAQTSGPALAGVLVSVLTVPWAVLVDAVSYLVSGLLLLRLPVTEPPTRRLPLRPIPSEAIEGLRWVYTHPTLKPYALCTHGWFLCNAVASADLPVFALQTLGLDAIGFGIALAIGGAGVLIGAVVATRLGLRFGAGPVVIASIALAAVAWATVALSHDQWPGWAVFGLGNYWSVYRWAPRTPTRWATSSRSIPRGEGRLGLRCSADPCVGTARPSRCWTTPSRP